MEIKQYHTLETLKDDFNFIFHMPAGASWGNAIDAAFEILQKINELSQKSVQAVNPSSVVNQAPINPADSASQSVEAAPEGE